MELICKGCGKKLKINSMVGGELLAITSILSHLMTCKETKTMAETQAQGMTEFLKVFFEIEKEGVKNVLEKL